MPSFRQRNLELEAEVRHERQANTSLRNEVRAPEVSGPPPVGAVAALSHSPFVLLLLPWQIDSLRSDNVKLYEKMKYMQTYSGAAKNTPDDVVDRYEPFLCCCAGPWLSHGHFFPRQRCAHCNCTTGPLAIRRNTRSTLIPLTPSMPRCAREGVCFAGDGICASADCPRVNVCASPWCPQLGHPCHTARRSSGGT